MLLPEERSVDAETLEQSPPFSNILLLSPCEERLHPGMYPFPLLEAHPLVGSGLCASSQGQHCGDSCRGKYEFYSFFPVKAAWWLTGDTWPPGRGSLQDPHPRLDLWLSALQGPEARHQANLCLFLNQIICWLLVEGSQARWPEPLEVRGF